MKSNYFFLLLALTALLIGCGSSQQDQLLGYWKLTVAEDDLAYDQFYLFSETEHEGKLCAFSKVHFRQTVGQASATIGARAFWYLKDGIYTLEYHDARLLSGNFPSHFMNAIGTVVESIKNQSYSFEIISLDENRLIVLDLDTRKTLTLNRVEYHNIYY